jgi:guanylate kinase
LRRRLDGRSSDAPDVIERRLENATGEIRECRWYDYVIVNDHFPRAVEELKAVVMAERCRVSRQTEDILRRYDICEP